MKKTIRRGDVVVVLWRPTGVQLYGDLGLVEELMPVYKVGGKIHHYWYRTTIMPDGGWIPLEADQLEVIDHINLGKDITPRFIITSPKISKAQIKTMQDKMLKQAHEKALENVQETEDKISVCDPTDQFPWPYNAKPSLLRKEEHCGPFWINNRFVDIVIDAFDPNNTEIRINCHDCAHNLQTIKLNADTCVSWLKDRSPGFVESHEKKVALDADEDRATQVDP